MPSPRRQLTAFTSVPRIFVIPAALGVLVVAGPLLGLGVNIPWSHLGELFADERAIAAAKLSVWTALTATCICGLLGIPLALVLTKALERTRFRSLGVLLYALIYTPVILSPVVSGLALTFFWGRRGLVGSWLFEAGITIPFTPVAVIIAQVFVGLPFFIATAVTTLKTIPYEFEEIARVEGATPWETTCKVLIPLATPGFATAFLLSFARALGVYGATVTFAGNMASKTQTLPLNIELMLSSNSMPQALGSALILISLYLIIGGLALLLLTLRKLRKVAP